MGFIVIAVLALAGLALRGKRASAGPPGVAMEIIETAVADALSDDGAELARCMTPERARRFRRRNI